MGIEIKVHFEKLRFFWSFYSYLSVVCFP